MAFESEQRDALHLLRGIENGVMRTSEIAGLVQEADPALVYLIFAWLRARYRSDPAAEGVIGRLVQLSNSHAAVPKLVKEGERDPIVEWFEESHAYRDFSAEEFIALVVEKLES